MTHEQLTEKAKEIIASFKKYYRPGDILDQESFNQWARTNEACSLISSLVGLESSEGVIKILRMIKRELLDVSFYYKEDMKRAIEDCLVLASVALEQIDDRENNK